MRPSFPASAPTGPKTATQFEQVDRKPGFRRLDVTDSKQAELNADSLVDKTSPEHVNTEALSSSNGAAAGIRGATRDSCYDGVFGDLDMDDDAFGAAGADVSRPGQEREYGYGSIDYDDLLTR